MTKKILEKLKSHIFTTILISSNINSKCLLSADNKKIDNFSVFKVIIRKAPIPVLLPGISTLIQNQTTINASPGFIIINNRNILVTSSAPT